MNPADHIRKYPNARPSTVAYLMRRDAVTEQLRRETKQAKESKDWSVVRFFRALGQIVRGV